MKIKELIKRIPFLYNPIVYVLNYYNKRRRRIAYRKYGVETLRVFTNCMDSNGYRYTLAFGSILGAIREHGFIKHDLDIDIFMWYEDYSEDMVVKLAQCGFERVRSFSIEYDKFGREDTFLHKGVSIDIFYLYPPIDRYPYCCDFIPINGKFKRMPRRIEIPISKKRKLVLFENLKVYIPDNAEQLCEFRYGPSYMKPDPNWHWESSYNAVKEWPEMQNRVTIEYKS